MKVNQTEFAGVTLQRPRLEKIELSAQNLVWPVDGMLVVILGGIERQTEDRVNVKMPILSKVPYADRVFRTHTVGRDATSLLGIMTVKMVEETPQQAQWGNDVVR